MSTDLADELALSISELIRVRRWQTGARLPERQLAEELRVSRSPIRRALEALREAGVVQYSQGEGYSVGTLSALVAIETDAKDDEATYLSIAADRIAGKLPDRVSESELTRRYGVSRAKIHKVLSRIAGEGWAERLPGSGWEFLATLTSTDSYEQSFRFRIINEPAAILEPTFELNKPALLECREQQLALIAGDIQFASPAELFEINSRVHEAILECSNNSFMIESIKRVNRLRRLMELGSKVERTVTTAFCHEHVQIIDLLLEGRRQEASDALRLHLSLVSRKKTGST